LKGSQERFLDALFRQISIPQPDKRIFKKNVMIRFNPDLGIDCI
jgi:hypothetical protein